jgi:hypothetical protein
MLEGTLKYDLEPCAFASNPERSDKPLLVRSVSEPRMGRWR